jgi:hypothetical protein
VDHTAAQLAAVAAGAVTAGGGAAEQVCQRTGVRTLYLVRERLAAHKQDLILITTPGGSAHAVLDLVQLSHLTGPGPARAHG